MRERSGESGFLKRSMTYPMSVKISNQERGNILIGVLLLLMVFAVIYLIMSNTEPLGKILDLFKGASERLPRP